MSKTEHNIDTANKIGTLFNSWGKIVSWVIGAIISCVWAYYEIYENKDDIALERKERTEQFKLSEERSEKRYTRAMETATELKYFIKYQQEEIIELKEEIAYMKGYEKGKEYYEKK